MNTIGEKKDQEEIIQTEDIKLILNQYHIGKKPLAKLLGWGETTIIRYIEGDIPSREYSEKLQRILEEPVYYYDLLMKRKDSLTGVAFRKSRKAALSMIMSSKINAISYYYVNKSNAEISADFIQILLYYTQGFSLAIHNREMFKEDFVVDENEKPYNDVYKSLKQSGIIELEVEDYHLSDEELSLINSVYRSFSWYGPSALKALTDHEKPFLRISRDRFGNRIVSKEAMKKYFRDVLYQYGINNEGDIFKYPDRRLRNIKSKYGVQVL